MVVAAGCKTAENKGFVMDFGRSETAGSWRLQSRLSLSFIFRNCFKSKIILSGRFWKLEKGRFFDL